MGRTYLAAGVVSLVAGYFSGYLAFEIVCLLLLPLGVFFTFVGNEPYVKSSTAAKSVVSTMRVLQEALAANSDTGHAVFYPGSEEHPEVLMYIPENDTPDGAVLSAAPKGHYYTPLGHELFEAYLKEVGGRVEKSLPHSLDQLRTITTSALELFDDVRFEVHHPTIEIRVKGATFAELGRYPELVRDVYGRAGCPVTNSMAEWICHCTGSRVRWVDATIDPITRSASVTLSLTGAE